MKQFKTRWIKQVGAGVLLFIGSLTRLVGEAQAMGGQPASGGAQPNMLVTMLPFVLMFVVMYFLIIRPQHKKQKDQQTMLDALKKGDKVVTSGGVHGTITGLKDKEGTGLASIAPTVTPWLFAHHSGGKGCPD